MPASAAMIGYGTKFAINTLASPAVFTDVAEIMSVTPPSEAIDVIDVTYMGSADLTREFKQGLMDPGEASFEMNFVPEFNVRRLHSGLAFEP